jgi:transcriptional regulator with XRE-family HTH domain
MPKRLRNYPRTYRKRVGFSQKELAFLLGGCGAGQVSKYESFARRPPLATALIYEQLFSTPMRKLFAGVYNEAQAALHRRARLLAEQLETKKGTERKRELLRTLISNPSNLTNE